MKFAILKMLKEFVSNVIQISTSIVTQIVKAVKISNANVMILFVKMMDLELVKMELVNVMTVYVLEIPIGALKLVISEFVLNVDKNNIVQQGMFVLKTNVFVKIIYVPLMLELMEMILMIT